MLPSWLKTVLIVGGIVAVVGAVIILWLLVKGADMRRKRSPSIIDETPKVFSQSNKDTREKS